MSDTPPTTLLDATMSIEPQLRRRISAISAEWDKGEVAARFSINLMTPYRGRVATVDTDDLPAGVTFAGFERWPDIERAIATEPDMWEQIRELNASGVLGRLDAARFDYGAPAVQAGYAPVSWTIKTHAGSQRERQAWVMGLLVFDKRAKLGLTQAQLAAVLGVHAVTISKWERGVLAVPVSIALALDALAAQRANTGAADS